MTLGYTKEEILKITKNIPSIYSHSIENIKSKLDNLILLGYSKTEVLAITANYPAIFCLSTESLNQKHAYLISLGYINEDIIQITTLYHLSMACLKKILVRKRLSTIQ